MPNLDGGHYFLTAILPIDNRGIVEHEGFKSSPIHMVREALETLPTALQSPATEEIGIQSPFARNTRTHLARFVVLDDPYYNGRDPEDSILGAIAGTDLLSPQPVDSLACPYLFFCADFDPVGDEPRSYLEGLWSVAERELTTVFQYCYGFNTVKDPKSFADFVIACQVETTMPFNDYWTIAPPFPSLAPWKLAAPPLLALIVAAVGIVMTGGWWLLWDSLAALAILAVGLASALSAVKRSGVNGAPPVSLLSLSIAPGIAMVVAVGLAVALGWPVLGAFLVILILLGLSLWADYSIVMSAGAKPFPTAPNSDLPHILKSLYLQQAFTHFAGAHQGEDPAALQAAFAAFVAQHKPDDVSGPTQPPGVIRSTIPEANHA